MNPRSLTLMSLALIACLGASGCATHQPEPKPAKQQAAESARNIDTDIHATQNQIDRTLASLHSLLSADPSLLQPAFARYSSDVDQMHAQAQRISDETVNLRNESQSYLSSWQSQHDQIRNAELLKTSEQRRLAVTDRFQGVQSSYDQARTSLNQFIQNLDDVRTALRVDLTPHGIDAVKQTNVVETTQQNGNAVKSSLNELQSSSAALAQALAPTVSATSSNNAPASSPSSGTATSASSANQ